MHFCFYFQTLKNLTNVEIADEIRKKLNDSKTYQDYEHYGASFNVTDDHGTANIAVIAPNGDAVVATGTINDL